MIYILWATIRIETFKKTLSHWLSTAVNPSNIKVRVAVNTQEERDMLLEFDDVIITNQKRIGTVYPAYLLTTSLMADENDIVIFASDDFYSPDGWDEFLINKLNNKCTAYFAYDGYQNIERKDIRASITMPVLTFSCLKKLNQILYSLDYLHYFGDTELHSNLKELDLLIDDRSIDNMLFEHRHYVIGKRGQDKYDIEYNSCVESDRNNYNRRMCLPVSERIKDVKGVWING